MIEVRRYQRLDGEVPLTDWLAGMRDARARAKLEIRFRRVSMGIFGDIKPVGEGVLELREDIGPGYRVYVGRHGATLVILLCGGDKRTQDTDIKRAKEMAERTCVLSNGRTVMAGASKDIQSDPVFTKTFLGLNDDNVVA